MSTLETHNIPLPEGYSIVERLGAGGYGEVWKATAPGGVEKAVKLVFGHCNEGMAEREQKSLERIKRVRHPFILSIERYEIVESRLVIVTELADMSLQDEFLRCQADGLVGIPRQRLISYLWDAAEALDYLVERHTLQHLDIKPENLLIVGDHLKVADFGLVKQLATQTLNSMMGGITPLYSAPEIFDDNPSSKSDQYSLAIVYQYMLTDSLPFPGRTPAQLAKQHTLAKPNLRPLSEGDRQIVAKALSKDPADRFGDCRELITALRSLDSRGTATSKSFPTENVNSTSPTPISSDTLPVAEQDTDLLSGAISSAGAKAQRAELERKEAERCPFPVVDPQTTDFDLPELTLEANDEAVPTLFVGVGGVGIRMLKSIGSRSQRTELGSETPFACLAIDTDRDSLSLGRNAQENSPLSHDDSLLIPLRRPKQYRDFSQNLLSWVSRRWLYNIPRSLQTRGFRPLGRIAAVDQAEAILTAIQSRLAGLNQRQGAPEDCPPLRVVILAGMSGGTGSGTVIDLAQAVRSLCRENSQSVSVTGVLGSTYELGSSDSLAAANMFSLLTELNHAQTEGNSGEGTPKGAPSLFESPRPPFDQVFVISIPKQGSAECAAKMQSIADYLLLEADKKTANLASMLRPTSQDSTEGFSLRTFECVDLGDLKDELNRTHRQQLIKAVTDYWLQESSEEVGSIGGFFGKYANCKFVQLVLKHYPEIEPVSSKAKGKAKVKEEEEFAEATQLRSIHVKQVAFAFSEHLQNCSPAKTEAPGLQVEEIGDHIVAEFIEMVRQVEMTEADLGQRFSELLIKAVSDVSENLQDVNPSQLVRTALGTDAHGPLECGYQRRSVLLVPENQDDDELLSALRAECPTVSLCQAAISQKFLIREGSGLRPLDLGARLAETFPDVDEAAGRLHTRNDINWLDLRESAPAVAAVS